MKGITALVCLVVVSLTSSPALAQECGPSERLSALRFLRQLSLDVRGRIPSFEEVETVRTAGDPEARVESLRSQWMGEDAFFDEARRQHRLLLWSNLEALGNIIPVTLRLQRRAADNVYQRVQQANRVLRGRVDLACLNERQVNFDATGRPIPIRTIADASCDVGFGAGTCVQEGYVEVTPVWGSAPIKVCAFDAMSDTQADGSSCGVPFQRGCGCGPGLRRCLDTASEASVLAALGAEPERIVEDVLRRDASYLEIFTSRKSFVDGRVAHYYRNLLLGATAEIRVDLTGYPAALGNIPEVPFSDTTWHEITRDAPHAGVLTTPAFLMRFNSHRARASRVATAFYCNPFIPPAAGIPAEEDEPDPNLRVRTGCGGCHERLEPLAAFWGRWRINGTYGFLTPQVYPLGPQDNCRCGGDSGRACNQYCNTYHVTPENSAASTLATFAAEPLAAIYLSTDERGALDRGPAALVDEPSEMEAIADCAVRTAAERLLGRELQGAELGWAAMHSEAFQADFNYRSMFERLLRDSKYRRTR